MTTSDQYHPLGPPDPEPQPAAPFSVTGPAQVTLGANRSATTTFAVTNLTGRPVRVRLLPQPAGGAEAGWFTLVGETERPVAVAATLSVDVQINVPPLAPPGPAAVRLDAVAEDNTEAVTGQSVSFTVPVPTPKSRPVWLIPAIIAVVVLLLAGGGYFVFFHKSAPAPVAAPTNVLPPTITGTAAVGQTLTANTGNWAGDPIRTVQWQLCPGAVVAACADIQTPESAAGAMATSTATGTASTTAAGSADQSASAAGSSAGSSAAVSESYVVAAADAGQGLRISVTAYALVGDLATIAAGPHTTVDSAMVSIPVPTMPMQMTTVPNFFGQTLDSAAAQAAAAHLNLGSLHDNSGAGGCSPTITGQNPPANTQQPWGTLVTVLIQMTPKFCTFPKITEVQQIPIFQLGGG